MCREPGSTARTVAPVVVPCLHSTSGLIPLEVLDSRSLLSHESGHAQISGALQSKLAPGSLVGTSDAT